MTRTLTKTDGGSDVVYTDGGFSLTVAKNTGELSVSFTITDENDPLYRTWQQYVQDIEQENSIL